MRICVLRALSLVGGALLGVGCSFKGVPSDVPGPSGQGVAVSQPGEGLPRWFPHAVDLRVHPASGYVLESRARRGEKRLLLDTWVELIDQMQEPIKGVGRLRIQLRLLDKSGGFQRDAAGEYRGAKWSFDLTGLASQQKYWDPVARAYRFGLNVEQVRRELVGARSVLYVVFEPAWPGAEPLPHGSNEGRRVELQTDWSSMPQ